MRARMEKIDHHLQAISLEVVTLECGDIIAMGKILNGFKELEKDLSVPENEIISKLKKMKESKILRRIDALGKDGNDLAQYIFNRCRKKHGGKWTFSGGLG